MRLIGLLVLCVAAFRADAVLAATVAREPFAPVTGPVRHGPGIAWLAGDPRGVMEVRVRDGAQRSAPLRLRATAGRTVIDASLASDGAFLALGVAETAGLPDVPAVSSRVFAGDASAALGPVAGPCTTDLLSQAPYRVALSDHLLASAGPDCGDRSLTDLRTGARVGALPAGSRHVARDGRFLAWSEDDPIAPGTVGEAIVVRDITSGRQSRVAASVRRLRLIDMDVDGHGNVAFLSTSRRSGLPVLFWASSADPTVRSRVLPRRWPARALELSDGTVALLQVPLGGPLERARVVLTELEPSARFELAASGIDGGGELRAPLDFDGTRLAVAARPCGRVDLIVARSGARALHRRPPARCRLRLLRPPRLTRSRLLVAIGCDGYRRRCQADSLRASTPSGRTVARDRFDGTPRSGALRLTALGRRLARRDALHRVRLTAQLGDYVDPRSRDRLHAVDIAVRARR